MGALREGAHTVQCVVRACVHACVRAGGRGGYAQAARGRKFVAVGWRRLGLSLAPNLHSLVKAAINDAVGPLLARSRAWWSRKSERPARAAQQG